MITAHDGRGRAAAGKGEGGFVKGSGEGQGSRRSQGIVAQCEAAPDVDGKKPLEINGAAGPETFVAQK